MKLTRQQSATYRFVKQYMDIHGISPTATEIAEGIGLDPKSTGVVHRYLSALKEYGYITRESNKRRNICLVSREYDLAINDGRARPLSLPIYGAIAAGRPIEAIDNALDDEDNHLDLTKIMGPNRFALHVRGDSMIGDNICDGDYVICESCREAGNGEIVVVLIDREEVTLKRLQRNACGTISLVPSNPSLDAMVYEASRVNVQGRYVGLLRV